MEYLPSPPSSPAVAYENHNDDTYYFSNDDEATVCGSCNKALGTDWFCSNCHKKCPTCSRILAQNTNEYCTRCWIYVPSHNIYIPSQRQLVAVMKALPSPTTSTKCSNGNNTH